MGNTCIFPGTRGSRTWGLMGSTEWKGHRAGGEENPACLNLARWCCIGGMLALSQLLHWLASSWKWLRVPQPLFSGLLGTEDEPVGPGGHGLPRGPGPGREVRAGPSCSRGDLSWEGTLLWQNPAWLPSPLPPCPAWPQFCRCPQAAPGDAGLQGGARCPQVPVQRPVGGRVPKADGQPPHQSPGVCPRPACCLASGTGGTKRLWEGNPHEGRLRPPGHGGAWPHQEAGPRGSCDGA